MSHTALSLDRDQYAAAHADPRRPLLVLAGPGSGKTQTLLGRIAHLHAHQCDGLTKTPARITALTFTRNAARELAARLHDHLDDVDAASVDVRTFHSFGLHLLRDGWAREYLGWGRFQVATAGQARQAATAAFAAGGLDIPPRDAARLIADYKVGQRPPSYGREPVRAAVRAYDADLHARRLIDLHDMLALPVAILRAYPPARADLQRRVAHIISDEAQDWNGYQAALVAYAGGPAGHITVVGDANQAIFGGSSPRYLLEFPLAYQHARVIPLTRTYRLHAPVLAVTTAVATRLGSATVTTSPSRRDGSPPTLHVARSAADEGAWLARELQDLHTSQSITHWADAVVLVRTRRQRRCIAQALTVAGIPCRVQAPALTATPTIATVLAWLALLRDGSDGDALVRAVALPARGQQAAANDGLCAALRATGPWTMDRLRRACPPGLTEDERRALGRFVRLYDGLVDLAAGGASTTVLDALLERTGLGQGAPLTESRIPRVSDEIAALRVLVAEEDDVGALQHLLAEEGATGGGSESDAVLVSTVHGFKGNEAEVVFLAGLVDGVFPPSLWPRRRGGGPAARVARVLCGTDACAVRALSLRVLRAGDAARTGTALAVPLVDPTSPAADGLIAPGARSTAPTRTGESGRS